MTEDREKAMKYDDLLVYLTKLMRECERYYPDNDSKQAGYADALADINDFVKGKHND